MSNDIILPDHKSSNLYTQIPDNNNSNFYVKISNEQNNIINHKNNIIVDAVAGSGKTTTILHFALKYPNLFIILITYNSALKNDVRQKAYELKIKNIQIHTYHSLAVSYYDKNAYTDENIKQILVTNMKLSLSYVGKIDILIIDEYQDISHDYFNFTKKVINDTKSIPKILLFCDKHQLIYNYKGANVNFIDMVNEIWNITFTSLSLSETFRLTKNITWFVNNVLLNEKRIISNKENGPKIDYYITNPKKIYKTIGKSIVKMMKYDNIKADDIFVLTPSTKSLNNASIKLENYLVKHKIKCITSSENTNLDSSTIEDKVVFTSFHQTKGRERKVVIIYNFDSSLFEYYLKNEEQNKCPNILYVALTRASYKLILIQDCKKNMLPFINLKYSDISKYVNFKQTDNINIQKTLIPDEKIYNYSVTDLVKFISPTIMDFIVKNCNNLFSCVRKELEYVTIISKIKNKNIYEDVSDLNGIIIPAMYEKKYFNEYSFIEISILENINSPQFNFIKKYVEKIKIPCVSIHDNLVASNIYSAINSNLHAKLSQITKYDWLSKTIVNKCHKNMDVIKTDKTKFEIPISYIHTINETKILINGRMDVINDENIYELKCVDHLTIEHKLQLIIYEYLCRKNNMKNIENLQFKLLNIRTGEILQLNIDTIIIDKLFDLIIENKLNDNKQLNNSEFIELLNNK